MSEATWAIVGALATGISLKLADFIFSRMAARTQESTQFRQELRSDLKDCRAENDRLEKENDALRTEIQSWREKYLGLKYPAKG